MTNYWFKRRRYGWGWIPVRWQGWAMLVIFLLIAILAAVVTLPADKAQPASWQQLFSFSLIMALDLALFIHVTVHHSPKPRWRWGKKPDDRPDEDF